MDGLCILFCVFFLFICLFFEQFSENLMNRVRMFPILTKYLIMFQEVLSQCAGDFVSGFSWHNLDTLNFSHNFISSLDDSLVRSWVGGGLLQ